MNLGTAVFGSEVRMMPTVQAARTGPATAVAAAETPRRSRQVKREATGQQRRPRQSLQQCLKNVLLLGVILLSVAAIRRYPAQPLVVEVPPFWKLVTALCYFFMMSVLLQVGFHVSRAVKAIYTPRPTAAAPTVRPSPLALATPSPTIAARTGTRTLDETHSAAGAARGESGDEAGAASGVAATDQPQEVPASPSQARASVSPAHVANEGERPRCGVTDAMARIMNLFRRSLLLVGGRKAPTAQGAEDAGRTLLTRGDVAEQGSTSPGAASARMPQSQPTLAAAASESGVTEYSHGQDLVWGSVAVTAAQQEGDKGVKITVNLNLKPKARRAG